MFGHFYTQFLFVQSRAADEDEAVGGVADGNERTGERGRQGKPADHRPQAHQGTQSKAVSDSVILLKIFVLRIYRARLHQQTDCSFVNQSKTL